MSTLQERLRREQCRDPSDALEAADALDAREREIARLREALTRAAENMKSAALFHGCDNCKVSESQAREVLRGGA